jgi:protocatechuate 3,4-dioxygenase beta subunit
LENLAMKSRLRAIEHGAIEHGAIEHGAIEHGAIEQGAIEQGAIEQGIAQKPFSRRVFAQGMAVGLAFFHVPGLFAEELSKTPKLTEGPFYPDKLPLDTDNDLIVLNNQVTPSVGEITHLSGKVLNERGEPIRNAFVEIWQVDHRGAYIHSQSANREKRDGNFQGYGRFLTDVHGQYYFRTIKPVSYPGRCPHIHIAVSRNGSRVLTTQLLIKGHPENQADGVTRELRDSKLLERVMAEFKPIPDSKIGELAAQFDLVLGVTPNEQDPPGIRGGIGKPEYRPRTGS